MLGKNNWISGFTMPLMLGVFHKQGYGDKLTLVDSQSYPQ